MAHKGYKQTEEHIKKRIGPCLEETKKKIRDTKKENPYKHNVERRRKISRAKKGKPTWNKGTTKETNKQALASSIRMKNNNPSKNLETRKKIKQSIKKRWDIIGRKKYKRSHHTTNTKEYKEWRMAVYLRDSFTCQYCGIKGVPLEAHHIKEWAKYPKLRYTISNGVTLCKNCHKLTRRFYGNQYISHAKHT